MFKIKGPMIIDLVNALIYLYDLITRLKKKREATDSQDKKNLKESFNETQTNVSKIEPQSIQKEYWHSQTQFS